MSILPLVYSFKSTNRTPKKFFADPLEIPNLMPAVFNALQPQPLERNSDLPEPSLTVPKHGLEALPIELLDHISSYLPARSLVSLRRSSQTLAFKIPFDEKFWRHHLCNGSLLPHVWDLEEETFKQLLQSTPDDRRWDWREISQRLRIHHNLSNKGKSNMDTLPVGFWNRCRIWSTIGSACNSPAAHTRSDEIIVNKPRIPERVSLPKTCAKIGFCALFAMVAWWDLRSTVT